MMDKVRGKFVLSAEIAVFVLLTVLLSVINIMNFAAAAEDADHIAQSVSRNKENFAKDDPNGNPAAEQNGMDIRPFRFGQFDPDSVEMNASLRYFIFSFDENGNAENVQFRMSAITEEEAEKWARSLINEDSGWTNTVYRYRVFDRKGKTFVVVIDQSRELNPCYRILNFSVAGEIVVLLLSFIILRIVGKILFKQFEDADRKQKKFISRVESEFKMPLTVINANTEALEKVHGQDEQILSINRQVRKMTKLVKNLSAFSIFEEKDMAASRINLSDMLNETLDSRKSAFEKKNIDLEYDIEPDIMTEGDEQALKKVFNELIENSLRYSLGKSSFSLKKQNDRIVLIQSNNTDLPNGSADQVFDRFTTLENAKGMETDGLGLSFVKDIIKAHNGRVSAKTASGYFTLRIDL